MSEQNKKIARKVFEEVQSRGNNALVDELLVEDYIGHNPLGDVHGAEGAKRFNRMLREAYPDLKITVKGQIAEGDKVATRWTASGTHEGEFQGMPPTGKQMAISGMTIFRIANGKLVEGWTNPDLLGMLQQIGAIAAPEQARQATGRKS